MNRVTGLAAVAAPLAVIAACGGGGGTDVVVKGFRFQPRDTTIGVGQTVTWTQEDDTTHTITSGTPGNTSGLFDHQGFGQGEKFSFTFEEAGRFEYHCAIHPEGMRGTIEVRQPDRRTK